MEHAKVTKYSDFFHKLRKKFYIIKPKICHKETFPKEIEEDVNLVTPDKESLNSSSATEVLISRGETLASLQYSLKLLTYRVPCMIQYMHEEEEVDSSASTLIEEHQRHITKRHFLRGKRRM